MALSIPLVMRKKPTDVAAARAGRGLLVLLLLGAATTFAGCAATAAASTEAPSPATLKKARGYFVRGTIAYELAEFPNAIDMYQRAYETIPDPVFLFNIAQAHRLSGRTDRARAYYRRYLEAAPQADNEASVRQLIADLDHPARSARR